MKIGHIISSLDARSGGTSEACAGMAMAQKEAGLNVRILATERAEEDLRIVKQLKACFQGGDGVLQVGPVVGSLARHPQLKKTVAALVAEADVVHLHGVWEEIQYLGAKEAIRQGTPWVWAPHGMLDPWSLSQGRIKKRLYWKWRWQHLVKSVARMHFITASEARLARAILPAGIEEVVEPLGTELSEQPGERSKATKQVLFLSRLHPKKNVECLIEAFAASDNPDWSLVIAGGGDESYRKDLERLAAQLEVDGKVKFTGDLRGEDKKNAFKEAALFCLPSHQENFGIVVIEALAAGCPVLLSPAVGLAEDLAECGPVKIVAGGPNEWAAEISGVLGNDQFCERVAEEGPRLVAERFSWEAIGSHWVNHYHQIQEGTP